MDPGLPRLFDRAAVDKHRARARRIGGEPFLALQSAEGIAERLTAINRRFRHGLLLDTLSPVNAVLAGFAETWDQATLEESERVPAGRESYDLAASVLSFHTVNDLPGVLRQIRGKLEPDGLLLASLLGGSTLFELRDSFAKAEIELNGGTSPRVAPLADVRDLGGLLQRAGFALPVADVERTTVLYRDFPALVRDLRMHGDTNALVERSRTPLPRRLLNSMLEFYRAFHSESDGRLRATFDIVYLTGWAPHESQQKPLQPGSAKARLAEALGTTERRLGKE